MIAEAWHALPSAIRRIKGSGSSGSGRGLEVWVREGGALAFGVEGMELWS